jgi:beta-phosphoglucomutase family hydrolase
MRQTVRKPVITRDRYDAVLFDLDGVITDTASLHAACWQQTFDEYLQKRAAETGEDFRPFDLAADYRLYVDGKPRLDGVRDFLASRGITLSEGHRDDSPDAATVAGLARRKNDLLNELIEHIGVGRFEGTVALIHELRDHGFKIAIVTASENCSAVLRAARLDTFFDVRVDGHTIRDQRLAGKPAPDTFVMAAKLLKVPPARAVVIEDAIAGVQAGFRGNFGLVIGVARKGNVEELRHHGADVVVTDLSELVDPDTVHALPSSEANAMRDALEATEDPAWALSHEGYNILTESALESSFGFGNGFLGMRAARSVSRGPTWVSWLGYSRWASWPRCYVAGLFDVPNIEPPVPALVPIADWSRVRILLDGEPLMAREGEVRVGTRTLDLRRGLLVSAWTHLTPAGITVEGRELRLLSLADRATGLQLLRLSLDRDGVDVRLEASFSMAGLGMEPARLEQDLGAWRLHGTGKGVAMSGDATLRLGGDPLAADRPFPLRWVWRWRSVAGQVAEMDRLVAVARADTPEDDPSTRAGGALTRNKMLGWRKVLSAHEAAWDTRWIASDLRIDGDDKLQRALRFAVYHLTSTVNPEDETVSIGARALTGDAYLGHVFWDTEIYLLPFYTAVWPEAARALLMYRFHTLPGAREKAAHYGFKGALYAWESADTGVETTPERVVAPDGTFVDILTGRMEHHISADIAYAVWQYWRASDDDEFFVNAGAQILLETARFWASRAVAEADGRRHIRHVIGPDEYHEDVDDNAFTNLMARWNLTRALETVGLLRMRWPHRARALREQLALTDEELEDWRDAVARIVTGLDPATGIYEQFAGFHALEPLDLAAYAERTVPIDVVIGRERTQRSQVVKQADVVTLIALLPQEFPGSMAEANFRHYEPRCAHGSSLSAGMHALVAARLGDADMALRYLRETAATNLDLDPNSAGGVRIAGLGALWQAVILGFAGLDLSGDVLGIDPRLPPEWRSLTFRANWRGRSVAITITGTTVQATLVRGDVMDIRIAGAAQKLLAGRTATEVLDAV